MKELTTFYGEGKFSNRRAIVLINNGIPMVEMYINVGSLWETKEFPNNTIQYAEDCAENFVMGIPK